MNLQDRREFLKFMGKSGISLSLLPLLNACQSMGLLSSSPIEPVSPNSADDLILSPGLKWQKLISWDEVINAGGEKFGFNNDYIAFFPLTSEDAILWVNHEYPDSYFVSGYRSGEKRTKEQVLEEQLSVGGSLLKIKKESDHWVVEKNHEYNRRIHGRTPIPFAKNAKIKGKSIAVGTLGNCAGGVTPWGSVLTCEERGTA